MNGGFGELAVSHDPANWTKTMQPGMPYGQAAIAGSGHLAFGFHSPQNRPFAMASQISERLGESTALLYNAPRSRSQKATVASSGWRLHSRCST